MRTALAILAIALGVFLCACGGGNSASPVKPSDNEGETYEVEVIDIKPAQSAIDLLSDDKLSDKKPVFDAALVDSRHLGSRRDDLWQLNASSAVIGLDIEDVGDEKGFDALHANYGAAAYALRDSHVMPSINMIDGKAKQFDDGLYAAIDLRLMFGGSLTGIDDLHRLCVALKGRVPDGSEARWFLEAALCLAVDSEMDDAPRPKRPEAVRQLLQDFEKSEIQSKPIGFYTWSDELKRCFKFARFLQQGFRDRNGVPNDLVAALRTLESVAQAKGVYETLIGAYTKLTNPFSALNLSDLMEHPDESLAQLWKRKGLPEGKTPTVHFLPYSTSRELELFNRLFPMGLPDGADLMLEFVKAIRSGRIDLKPRPNSGWYDYQVHALETFLLPERGSENSKLLLTKKYKQRMLEAFKALVMKRRETHVRELEAGAGSGMPPTEISPRLRVEPNPTYYLRTARAYAFLETFVYEWMKGSGISPIHGQREQGDRPLALHDELKSIRDFFYGLHLISCEDIGKRPELLEGEVAKPGDCYLMAARWAERWFDFSGAGNDPKAKTIVQKEALWRSDHDLAVDTRLAIPIYFNPNSTRCWGTLGVRPVKLRAWYATPPKWRPMENNAGKGEWEEVPSHRLADAHYIILTDEFGEFTLKGNRVLNRAEFRDFCDCGRTKQGILAALQK